MVTDADREFLLRSLADLDREHDAGDLADADHADLTARYRAKLESLASLASLDARTSDPDPQRRWWRVVATVVVVGAVGVGGGLAVAAWSGSRKPGDTITGGVPSTAAQRLAEAAGLVASGDAAGAIELYRSILDENPEDVAALTYFGWLLRNLSLQQDDERLFESGVGFIERATQIDPEYSEAWFFRGIIYLRDEEQPDRAVDALRLALANDPLPEVEAAARELLAEIAQSP